MLHHELPYNVPLEAVLHGFDGRDWSITDTALLGDAIALRQLDGEGYLRYVNGRYVLSSVKQPRVSRRQTVLSGKMRPDGKPQFLRKNGFNVDILAENDPLILAFAAGFDEGGAIDFVETINQNILNAWTLTPNSTNYVYIERQPNGKLSFGISNSAPHYGERDRPKIDYAYNLCDSTTGGKVIASSFATSSWLPEYAFQNNDSMWIGGIGYPRSAKNNWIAWDFGDGNPQEVRILEFEQKPGDGSSNGKTREWLFEVSDDLANWELVCVVSADIDGSAANGQAYPHHRIPPHGKHRAFRLRTNVETESGVGWGPRVRLIRAFGADTTANHHWFDTNRMVMIANGVPVERLFVGEVVTDAVRITNLTTYAFLGRNCIRFGLNNNYDDDLANPEIDYNLGCDPQILEVSSSLYPGYPEETDAYRFYLNEYGEFNWRNLAPNYPAMSYYRHFSNNLYYWELVGLHGAIGRNQWRNNFSSSQPYFANRSLIKSTSNDYGGTWNRTTVVSHQIFVDRGWS